MYYLHYYEEESGFTQDYWGDVYHEPWVSLITEIERSDYNKKAAGTYLTIEALTTGAIIWKSTTNDIVRTIEYSKNGLDWTEITSSTNGSTSYIHVEAGDRVMFRGNNQQYAEVIDPGYLDPQYGNPDPYASANVRTVSFNNTTCDFKVYGNIMSLIRKDPAEFSELKDLSGECNFYGMFYVTNSRVKSIEGLILPATGITNGCYGYMFNNQSIRTPMDELPASTVMNSCYRAMFNGCTNLTCVPELSNTNVADSCFRRMFYGCSSLTGVPADYLSVVDLENVWACYSSMFFNCTSLVSPPDLPSEHVGESCYYGMFNNTAIRTAPELPSMKVKRCSYQFMFGNCKNLVAAPELPATEIDEQCYQQMFSGCTSLVSAPSILPSTSVYKQCYMSMFRNCTSLTTAPELPAPSLNAAQCYSEMFLGCKALNYIKCLATSRTGSSCTNTWVSNVAETGMFVKSPDATSWPIDDASGIPAGWTVIDA